MWRRWFLGLFVVFFLRNVVEEIVGKTSTEENCENKHGIIHNFFSKIHTYTELYMSGLKFFPK